MLGGRVVPNDSEERIETAMQEKVLLLLVVSIHPARFDFAIAPLSATGLLNHRVASMPNPAWRIHLGRWQVRVP